MELKQNGSDASTRGPAEYFTGTVRIFKAPPPSRTSGAQASEVFTQLAFYAAWPDVFSALPVAKDVFENRGR